MDTVSDSSQKVTIAAHDISKGDLPAGISREAAMRDVHVVDENGHVYRGSEAVLRVFEEYPRLRWIATVGRWPVFRQLAAVTYRIIEKTRYWIFGRASQ